jgi:hypothetical protein
VVAVRIAIILVDVKSPNLPNEELVEKVHILAHAAWEAGVVVILHWEVVVDEEVVAAGLDC